LPARAKIIKIQRPDFRGKKFGFRSGQTALMPTSTKPNKIIIDTLIISDIHLGDRHTRCQEILDLLDKYDYKKLILNGDIIDGLRLQRLHTGHWKILSKLRRLSKNHEVIWVHGNHDAEPNLLSQLLGLKVYKRYIWQSENKKFLAIHGHQYDRFLNNNLIISRLAYASYSFLKRLNPSGYLTDLIRNHNKTWQRSSLEVAKGAIRLGRLLGANYVFCGHTHKIYEAESYGIKYYNTGSWDEKPSAYAMVSGNKVMFNKVD